ncbi:MAG: acyl-CoA thioesterase [Chloroflexi bacterium]|nr:acyl-CoA thioesterase [Chloroflexota bacterium]
MTEPYRYHTSFRVRFHETDLQGHVNFGWYLQYFDVALIEYLRELDYTYHQIRDDHVDLFYVDSHVSYKSSCVFDELLRVHCRIGHIGNSSVRFDFQMFAELDNRLVATGEIIGVTAVPQTKEKLRVPERLRTAVANYEKT